MGVLKKIGEGERTKKKELKNRDMDIETLSKRTCEKIDEILHMIDRGEIYRVSENEDEYPLASVSADYIKSNKFALVQRFIGGSIEIQMINPNGSNLIQEGGLTAIYNKKHEIEARKIEFDELSKSVLMLQKSDFEHKEKIRLQEGIIRTWKLVSAIIGLVCFVGWFLLVLCSILFFKN